MSELDLSALEAEAAGSETLAVTIPGGSVLTFPSPQDFTWTQVEKFMGDANENPFVFLRTWLSEDDYQKLSDANLKVSVVEKIIEQVNTHFEGTLGSQGN